MSAVTPKLAQQLRTHRTGWILGAVVLTFVVVGIVGPLFWPYPSGFGPEVLQPPSWKHPFGTDSLGLDVLAQVVWGTRTSLFVSLGAGAIAVLIGTVVGLCSAYSRWLDRIFGAIIDLFLSLPLLPLMIVIAALMGPSLLVLITIIGVFSWPQLSRVVRSQTLVVLTESYIAASEALGAPAWWILGRQVLPAVLPFIGLHGSLAAARAVLGEASLSFLGLSDHQEWSWGRILSNAQRDGVLVHAWWQTAFPSLMILLFIGAVTLWCIRYTDTLDNVRIKLPAK